MRLLEAVQLHGDSWSAVARYVGRTQRECIVQLLQLPLDTPSEPNWCARVVC